MSSITLRFLFFLSTCAKIFEFLTFSNIEKRRNTIRPEISSSVKLEVGQQNGRSQGSVEMRLEIG